MAPRKRRRFDPDAILDSAGVERTTVAYVAGESVYSQGEACDTVLYVKSGEVTLSVASTTGRRAIVAVLGPGNFFGEGALAGQPLRLGSATAQTPSTIVAIGTADMRRRLHEEHALSDSFIIHLLSRNIRIEEDLIEQLFDSVEKRLARTLLLLARYGEEAAPHHVIPRVSRERLAGMVGTTPSRVAFFMNRFKKLKFISADGGLTVNNSLVSVVLND
jgi:CRP/FNR family transcriptional regulator, cyclic AMP receptor protein